MKTLLIFDFDGTLTPYSLSKLGVLEEIGFDGGGNNENFIRLVQDRMKSDNINVYEAFFKTLFYVIDLNGYKINDESLSIGSKLLEYNKGVNEFFEYFSNQDVDFYMISSGVKPYLDNTLIAKFFKKIYATNFVYRNNDIIGIENLVTDIKKVDIVKKIVSDNNLDNCSNIVYFGDGLTDIPIMDYIRKNGGTTVFLYDSIEEISSVNKDVVSYFFNKDYSMNSELFSTIHMIVNK